MRWPWLAGTLGGFAVLSDYLAIFSFAAVGFALLARRVSWRERIAFGVAAALPLLALLLYQHAIFGGFLTTASSQSNPVFLDQTRTFGLIGRFDGSALFGLLFSLWRGLFLYCPVLLLSCVGAWQRWRGGSWALVVACSTGFAAQLLFLSSVAGWWGGSAAGSRYLITCIPLFAMLAPRAGALAPWARALLYGALALSVCNMLTLTAVDLMLDEAEQDPLYGLSYLLLAMGRYPHLVDATNLGQWLGLLPPWDLALFLLAFGGWAIGLLRSTRAADRRS
jgi:hypothetical protein